MRLRNLSLIDRLFGKRETQEHSSNNTEYVEQLTVMPISESNWFLTHTRSVKNELEFLLSDFDFKLIKDEFVGHEYWIIYKKENIEVEIWSDFGDLPFICIRNTKLPYNEAEQKYNTIIIDKLNDRAKQIREQWNTRIEPIRAKFVDNWVEKDKIILTELETEYQEFGKLQHVEYIKQAALTVRDILENNIELLQSME